MSGKKIKAKDFDAAEWLDSPETIAAYLNGVIEENNPELFTLALSDIARAKGMTEISKASGITREALYKALRENSKPRFDTINRIVTAMGIRLIAQPISATSAN
jgi:probable addiction module antidote protein